MTPHRHRASISLGRTNAAILHGDEDLTLWSEEELIRGPRRDKNGSWSGRPPKVVPKAVHDELVRRPTAKAAPGREPSSLNWTQPETTGPQIAARTGYSDTVRRNR